MDFLNRLDVKFMPLILLDHTPVTKSNAITTKMTMKETFMGARKERNPRSEAPASC